MIRGDKIDLHMHSTVSDGTYTPRELFAKVKEAGLQVFSLTDHDGYLGCGEAAELAGRDGGIRFLNGIEFSCEDDRGKYHILGYRFDPEAQSMKAIVRRSHDKRMTEVTGRLKMLEEQYGFAFTQEELDGLMALDNPGKPHMANMMVKKGWAKDINDGIENYLNHCNPEVENIAPEDAIKAVLDGGGIPVLAHGWFGGGGHVPISPEKLRERVSRLAGCGLKGLEGFYSGFSDRQREEILALAEEMDLYVTAGSDCHGANKAQLATCRCAR